MATSSAEKENTKHAEGSSSSSAAAAGPRRDELCFTDTAGVITTTMFDVPGYRVVRVMGTVYGISVRSRNLGTSYGMAFKSIVGGELRGFTKMLYSARNDALGRIVKECRRRGGNAIVALRFDAGDLGGWAQVCAYGTAALVERIDDGSGGAGTEYTQLARSSPGGGRGG